MPSLSVHFDPATVESIERYQRRCMRRLGTLPSRSEIVRDAVAEYLAQDKQKNPTRPQEDDSK